MKINVVTLNEGHGVVDGLDTKAEKRELAQK